MSDQRACRGEGVDPDMWFAAPETLEAHHARNLCIQCPLYWQCQEYAIREGIPYGIWGGMGAAERRRVWKQRGGRPLTFEQVIDAQVRPLLQARRDEEREMAS